MIRRPPRSTLDRSSAASDVYKRQHQHGVGHPGGARGDDTKAYPREDEGVVALGDDVALALVPVSYTHLRAHETVLDLVCRLLLEKKKPLRHKHTLSAQHC